MALRIEVDRQRCMASGNCSLWAPAVFDHDDEGVAIVVDPDGAPEEETLTAARNCPTASIAVWRDDERLA